MESTNPHRRKSNAKAAAAPSSQQQTIISVSEVTPAKDKLPEVSYVEAVGAQLTEPPSLFPERISDSEESEVEFAEALSEEFAVAPPVPRQFEACSRYYGRLVANVDYHPVIAAVHLAFHDHRPLVLSPDIIWLLVAQGFANHVNANAEKLRPKFVQHEGKLTLEVERHDFIKGSPENPWPEVFGEFSSQIRKHLGPSTHDLLLPRFSTTGPVEQAAAEIVLLEAMQSYFDYRFYTLCGIPQIMLEGSTNDWEILAERTRALGQFGLAWWTEAIAPVLDEFVAATRGEVNQDFWRSIYKVGGVSGGPYISGWIAAFFPYLLDGGESAATNRNPYLKKTYRNLRDFLHLAKTHRDLHDFLYPKEEDDPSCSSHGMSLQSFPAGLSRAPFTWKYLTQKFKMEFIGGFVGVDQDPSSLALKPEIGWAVGSAND